MVILLRNLKVGTWSHDDFQVRFISSYGRPGRPFSGELQPFVFGARVGSIVLLRSDQVVFAFKQRSWYGTRCFFVQWFWVLSNLVFCARRFSRKSSGPNSAICMFPKNSGTPKSSILIGFSIILTIHFGVFPLFLVQHPYDLSSWTPSNLEKFVSNGVVSYDPT